MQGMLYLDLGMDREAAEDNEAVELHFRVRGVLEHAGENDLHRVALDDVRVILLGHRKGAQQPRALLDQLGRAHVLVHPDKHGVDPAGLEHGLVGSGLSAQDADRGE
eukprot:2592048-Rhodomonas_salina.3